MNDANDPVVIEAETSPAAADSAARPSRGGKPVLPLVLAVLALAAAIGVGVAAYFTWFEVRRVGAEQAGIESGVSERLQPVRRAVDGLDERQATDRRALEARIEALSGEQQAITHRLGVIAARMGRSEDGWTLAEVEYLLRIAGQRLQLQRDTATAAQALRAADGRLRDLADPHYRNVRQQIARELDAVESVPQVDTEGLSAALSAALEQVDRLPVAGSRYRPAGEPAVDRQAGSDAASDAGELGGLVWQSLSDLFRLREHDRPVRPMLPPDSEFFLRENLRLQLAAARLALLRRDSGQYRSALQTAGDWLAEYFDSEAPEVEQLAGRLQQTAAVDITPPLPEVSTSLRLLREQMKLAQEQEILPVVPDTGAEADRQAPQADAQAGGDGDGDAQ